MEERILTCIGCPQGCQLKIKLDGKKVLGMEGNNCKVGEKYGAKEVVSPERTVTSTVRLDSRRLRRLPVRTKTDIPKDKMAECMKELNCLEAHVPVHRGDIILKDVAGTGVDVIATRDAEE